jgi:hypothetical protein
MTHLGTFEGVDQTALADIREADGADGDALRCVWFVHVEEAEQRRCCSRGKICVLMQACGAEGECRGCVAEVFEPRLGILVRHQIYKPARAKPRIMSITREAQRVY